MNKEKKNNEKGKNLDDRFVTKPGDIRIIKK